MISHDQIEHGTEWHFNFEKLSNIAAKIDPKHPCVPVVVQNAQSKEVLMCAYADEDALRYTLENKIATFWSTSRHELWIKGKTSGDILKVIEIRVNCEQNSLLYLVEPMHEGICHVKDRNGNTLPSCYYRKIQYITTNKSISLELLPGFKL
jgi:phosphoribosyl-AMP cyclohydrolase